MKIRLFILSITAAVFSALSQQSIQLPGYGAIPYVDNNQNFTVNFKEYGAFDFTGTIQPLSLKTTVTIDQLKKIPGYKILKELELLEATLIVSPEGFELEAKADTKKKLKTVCEAMHIAEPYLLVKAKIGPKSFALEGGLDYSSNPIIIDVNKSIGTRITLEKFSIGAEVEAGSGLDAVLYVKNEIRFRPTIHDPDLKTVMELSFNLISLELKGAFSMTDEWQDPFGLSHYVGTKKTDIAIANTAVELGWIIGSPTPTTIGFAVGKAKFFDIEFGAAMSIAPANAEIALKAYTKRITMKQFENTLRNGFGLKIPDIFPKNDDIYIDDTYILFAPNGGEIGEFEIEKGFAFRGGVKFSTLMEGSVEFYVNPDEGFLFDMYMNAEQMYKMIEEAIKKQPESNTKKVMLMAFNTLQIRMIHLHMEADKNLNLMGATACKLVVFGKKISFDVQGSFNPKEMLSVIMDKIGNEVITYMKDLGAEVTKIASAAASSSINTAKDGWNEVSAFAGHATTWTEHMTHGDDCFTKCVPKRAKKLYTPVYKSSNKAVDEFYYKVIPKVAKLDNKEEREKYIKADWDRLLVSIDADWEKAIKDDYYKGFDKDPSDVEKLGKEYRRIVKEKKQEHVNHRNKMWDKLMTDNNMPKPIDEKYNNLKDVFFIGSIADNEIFMDIPGNHFNASTKDAKVGMYKQDYGIDRFIKTIPSKEEGFVYLQAQHSDLVFTAKGGEGANIILDKKLENNANQLFKLLEIPGKSLTYYLQCKESGLYLTSNGDKQSITQNKITRTKNQQWSFEPAKASDMAPLPEGYAFALRNIKAKRYMDLGGSGKDAGTKDAHVQLWDMDGGADRYVQLEESHIEGYHFVHHMHSGSAYWDIEGGGKDNGTKLQLWDLSRGGGQQFRFIFAGSPMTFYIENPARAKFIDASNSKINENGCPIQIWDENGSENQQWKLEPIGSKWFAPEKAIRVKIKMAYSNKYWDLAGDGSKAKVNGSKLQIWDMDGGIDRFFTIKKSGDHDWVWIEMDGGKRIDVTNGEIKKKGTGLQTWDANTGDAQKFAIHPTGKNTCTIQVKGWKALDVKGGKIGDNGSIIQIWNLNLEGSQQFQLIDVKTNKPIDFTNLAN
ncbi:MAG: RICIN domain-containing protein [Bacteroidales bacterium]|nr:RICIN domain-containing protein [Bacteroidales bacterium]